MAPIAEEASLEAQAKRRKKLAKQMGKNALMKLRRTEDVHAIRELLCKSQLVVEYCLQELPAKEVQPLRDWCRMAHNRIKDLEGSIRVFIRIRSWNQRENDLVSSKASMKGTKECVAVTDDRMGLELTDKTPKKITVNFDTIMAPGTQEEMWAEVKPLVGQIFDGYNVAMLTFGHSGTGKTYTMYGTPENPGIMTRAAKEVMGMRLLLQDKCKSKVTVSIVELHDGQFYDLALATSMKDKPKISGGPKKNASGETVLNGCVDIPVKTEQQLLALVTNAEAKRRTAPTALCPCSSRSHTFMTVKIVLQNRETKRKVHGKITLADLAGQERVKDSMVDGQDLKECGSR